MTEIPEAVVEKVAKALVISRGGSVVASDAEWPYAVQHYREMATKYPDYAEGSSLITDAFRDARAALQASPLMEVAERLTNARDQIRHLQMFPEHVGDDATNRLLGLIDAALAQFAPGEEG